MALGIVKIYLGSPFPANRRCSWSVGSQSVVVDPMRKICAKMVPKLLNEGQKERRVQVCQGILKQLETEPNLVKRDVTGNESWIFEYDPLT